MTNRPVARAVVGLVLLLALVSACSKNTGGPAQAASATSGAGTPSPGPKPGDSNNPDYIAIRFTCAGPPLPADAGASPVNTREVFYEDFGPNQPARPATTTLRPASGGQRASTVTLDQSQRERLYGAALAAFNQPPTEPEHAAVGEVCKLALFRSFMQLDTQILLTTNNASLRPLVNELAPLLLALPAK